MANSQRKLSCDAGSSQHLLEMPGLTWIQYLLNNPIMLKGFHWKGSTPGPCHCPCGWSQLSRAFQILSAGSFVTHEEIPETSILRDKCSCHQPIHHNLCTSWIFQTKAKSYEGHNEIILATQELIFPKRNICMLGELWGWICTTVAPAKPVLWIKSLQFLKPENLVTFRAYGYSFK